MKYLLGSSAKNVERLSFSLEVCYHMCCVMYKHWMLWQINFPAMNYVRTALTPLSPLLRAASTALSDSSVTELIPGFQSHSQLNLSHHCTRVPPWLAFCFQWAKCLIVKFSATMTNIISFGINPFHKASLIYYKWKPSLRFIYIYINYFFFFLCILPQGKL